MEVVHRDVTYQVEVPDNWDLSNLSSDNHEELDNLLSRATPGFGVETIVDVFTVGTKRV